jgi:membrane-associated protein
MTQFLNQITSLHGVVVYLLVALVVFAEDALFVGFVVPGETAAVLGGVAASRGHASFPLMVAVVVFAAVVGDTVGYEVGARFGHRLLGLNVLRRRRHRIEGARQMLARRGGPAVFLGRFVAFLRAMMPFLAGVSHMAYPKFLAYNAAGGLVWGAGAVTLGYLAGTSYSAIERAFGEVAAIAFGVLVVAVAVAWAIRRRGRSRDHDLDQSGVRRAP